MEAKLLHPVIQQFISENLNSDIQTLILSKKTIEEISIQEIVKQIECKKKAYKKLPTWYHTPSILYHEKINIEQTSSEKTALYKSELVSGKNMVDLTSGFGVDSFYFSKKFKSITLCEMNLELIRKVKHNYQELSVSNAQFYEGNGLDFLSQINNTFDLIYLDPARRNQEKKVFLLEDCLPNVFENQTLLLEKSKSVLIKLSPLFDIKELTRKLSHIKAIYIIAVKNDVKELLIELERSFKGETTLICENLETNQPSFKFQFTQSARAIYASELKKYLYEPNASIYKSGAFDLISEFFQLEKLAPNTHLYTSDILIPDFPGKLFEISALHSSKTLKKALTKTHYNIISRNYPLKVHEIKKKYRLSEGGTYFLIFTQLGTKKQVLLCQKKSI